MEPITGQVREFLTAYNKAKGYSTNDATLIETMCEANNVMVGQGEEHRWYTEFSRVVQLDDKFIQFTDYRIKNEDTMDDMGLSYNLDAAYFVVPKNVMTTVYVRA